MESKAGKKKISVIVPAYQAELFLENCLEAYSLNLDQL